MVVGFIPFVGSLWRGKYRISAKFITPTDAVVLRSSHPEFIVGQTYYLLARKTSK